MSQTPSSRRSLSALLVFICLVLAAAGTAHAQPPTFDKAFSPSTIGPGSVSRLTFTITNVSASPVTDLAFVDTLPAGVTLASPAIGSSSCGGTLSAPSGGTTITFSGGTVGGGASCTVTADVTSGTPGTHMNVSGDLTSSVGTSGIASADLTVATDRPGFSKSFTPSSIGLGGRSTLTFLVDNTANGSLASSLIFTDDLPAGMVVADPANASDGCGGGMLTATAGSSVISYFGGFVAAGASCAISVDVTATGAGSLENSSGELTSFIGVSTRNSGLANATLEVTAGTLTLTKAFTDDPVNPGSTVTLEFTLQNRDRNLPATGITFTDDLDATLTGLVATGLPQNDVCGAGSVLSGTGLITLSGGSLPAEGSCTFSVTLQVPAGAAAGAYPNTTSSPSADLGGSPVVGAPATETLFVNDAPTLTKTFLVDPVAAGGTTTVEFTITNTSSTSSATDIAFEDNLSAFLSAIVVTALPADGFCGGGSSMGTAIVLDDLILFMTGGSLAPGASCTFTVDLMVPAGTAGGTYVNTTDPISATVDGTTQEGRPASDDLTVLAAPSITKSFTDDPVLPGATVTLEFTISHDELALADATDVAFTDDLSAVLSGLMAVGLPQNDVCGTGSQISGTTMLSLTGGNLVPGASCVFSVTLQVPAAALPGNYPNATSDLTATVGGLTATSPGASDTLRITGLTLSKSFTDDPALAGGTVTLEFTLSNVTASSDATNIFFTDNLSAALSGLTAIALPPPGFCGAGSQITGTSNLIFFGGSLTAGTSCTFSVTLEVPAGASNGDYLNTTSNLSATIGGSAVVLDPAADVLEVSDERILFSKSFTDDPAVPGGTVTLEFTLTNTDATQPITALGFTDDLSAALPGLAAVGLPMSNVCGAGSQISGTSTLTLTGGSLAAGGSCTFSVTLQLPASVPAGGTVTNTTSQATGMIGGLGVVGAPASDDLLLVVLSFSKAFDGPTLPGGTPVLTFTIENLSTTDSVSGLGFTDDLSAVLPGLAAIGLPLSGVCGAGSTVSGTPLLTFSQGSLGPGATCSFGVSLQVPAGTAAGTYPNTTSALTFGGLFGSDPATADLVVEPPPLFSKAFAPDPVLTTQPSTLTFTIDNTASSLAVGNLAFTDALPGPVVVATPANASTTCAGGTLTATPGSGTISYTGGTVPALSSCTVSVDVTSPTAGSFTNVSGDLTSDAGSSGTASDTLSVEGPPAFSKAFAPGVVLPTQPSTLTFTIDNTANTLAVGGLAFTDTLPVPVVVATPANASTTCTGGTLTATPGSGTVSYAGGTVAPGVSCVVSVDVVSPAAGTYTNVSGDLSSDAGSSGTATAALTVEPPPTFAKSFAPSVIQPGGVSTLTFTLDNAASSLGVGNLAFTDVLPAAVTVATPANATTDCAGASLTAPDGGGTITFSGGTLGAGASCTASVDVTSSTLGTHVNTTGDLTSDAGSSGTATAELEVVGDVELSKAFLSAPVLPGGDVELELTVTNPSASATLTDIAFSDDLGAVIPGLAAVGLPAADVCGAGSQLTGTSVISLTGGSLAPAGSCTFTVTVRLPADAADGLYLNTTSQVTATAAGESVVGPAATAELEVAFLGFEKVFADPMVASGGTTVLSFTITNPDPANGATGISFSDDLDAALAGLAAVGLPMSDVCGAGSLIDGTSLLLLTGGVLGPSESCTFGVTVQVPAGVPPITVTNVTSALEAVVGGAPVVGDPASAATAELVIEGIVTEIPTLGTWGLILLAGLLGLLAVRRLRLE